MLPSVHKNYSGNGWEGSKISQNSKPQNQKSKLQPPKSKIQNPGSAQPFYGLWRGIGFPFCRGTFKGVIYMIWYHFTIWKHQKKPLGISSIWTSFSSFPDLLSPLSGVSHDLARSPKPRKLVMPRRWTGFDSGGVETSCHRGRTWNKIIWEYLLFENQFQHLQFFLIPFIGFRHFFWPGVQIQGRGWCWEGASTGFDSGGVETSCHRGRTWNKIIWEYLLFENQFQHFQIFFIPFMGFRPFFWPGVQIQGRGWCWEGASTGFDSGGVETSCHRGRTWNKIIWEYLLFENQFQHFQIFYPLYIGFRPFFWPGVQIQGRGWCCEGASLVSGGIEKSCHRGRTWNKRHQKTNLRISSIWKSFSSFPDLLSLLSGVSHDLARSPKPRKLVMPRRWTGFDSGGIGYRKKLPQRQNMEQENHFGSPCELRARSCTPIL